MKSARKLDFRYLLVILVASLLSGVVGALAYGSYLNSQTATTQDNHTKSCEIRLDPQQLGGCVFWSRSDYLRYNENWYQSFKQQEDSEYCSRKYDSQSPGSRYLDPRDFDPKCSFNAFEDLKRKENWEYLTSTNKDQYYNLCVEERCGK